MSFFSFGATPGFQLDDSFTVDTDTVSSQTPMDFNANLQPDAAADRAAADAAVNSAWSTNGSDGQYHPNPPPAVIPGNATGSGGGFLSSLTDIFKATAVGTQAVATLVNVHGQPLGPNGLPLVPQVPPPTVPVWVMPAVVVLGGLALIVVLKKSRKSSMAGYRRKSRKSRKSRR